MNDDQVLQDALIKLVRGNPRGLTARVGSILTALTNVVKFLTNSHPKSLVLLLKPTRKPPILIHSIN